MTNAFSKRSDNSISGTAKRSERLAALLEAISEHGEHSLQGLAGQFRTSPATMRRDLTVLAERGLIMRTHGGAKASSSRPEMPVSLRDTRFQESKSRIARAVAARIPRERHAVALSGGSTTASVARELRNHHELTIVTNSLTIASLASSHPRLKVVMTGGLLRPQSLELVGVLAEGTFTAVNVGTAVLGADGVSLEAGITTHDETEARTNHAMVVKAKRTIVVADGSKIGVAALALMAGASEIDMLVTDESADPEELARLRSAGVDVVIA